MLTHVLPAVHARCRYVHVICSLADADGKEREGGRGGGRARRALPAGLGGLGGSWRPWPPPGPVDWGPGCLCSVISPLPASTPPRYHSLVSLPCYRLGNNGEWQCGTAALQWPITPHRCGDGPEAVHCGTGLRSAIFRLGPCAGARTCRRRQVLSRGCIGLSAADTAER